MKNNSRKCCECGEPIINCMGMVNAGDWLSRKKNIRELCGKCVMRKDIEHNLTMKKSE